MRIPCRHLRRVVLGLLAAVLIGVEAQAVREIEWFELVPKGWDPEQAWRDHSASRLPDADPRAQALLREARAAWDNAPTRPELDGIKIRLPGYLVPLEGGSGEWKEFLVVPYFGACLHSPPPAANQIVHVKVAKPLKGLRTMDTVWVTGTLRAARADTGMGVSGYRLEAAEVTRYTAPR